MLISTSRLFRLFCFLCFVAALQSCGPGGPGVWKNGHISPGMQSKLHGLNDVLFTGIKDDKAYEVDPILSAEMLADGDYKRILQILHNRTADGYALFDEFYIVNLRKTDTHDTTTNAIDGTSYRLKTQATTEEQYLAFFTTKSSTGDKWMITATYCNFDYGWKLNSLTIDQYAIGGKNAVQLYAQAKQQIAKGYLVDAVATMELSAKIMRPSQLWQYPQEDDMSKFYNELLSKANAQYKFPIVVAGAPSKPLIFRITNEKRDQGTYTAIYYVSPINIADTNAVKRENDNIVKAIGKTLPGVDKDKKYLYFSVFNHKPTSQKTEPSFDITVKL